MQACRRYCGLMHNYSSNRANDWGNNDFYGREGHFNLLGDNRTHLDLSGPSFISVDCTKGDGLIIRYIRSPRIYVNSREWRRKDRAWRPGRIALQNAIALHEYHYPRKGVGIASQSTRCPQRRSHSLYHPLVCVVHCYES